MYKDILPLSPVDIQLEILSYLEDYRSLIRWTRVSKRWRDFIRSPSLEPLYRRFVDGNWPKEYKQISRRRACPTNSQTPRFGEILSTLERNLVDIKEGRLHEAGTFVIPQVGHVEFCYANGYLAAFTPGKSGTAERDIIYVYDLSIALNPTTVINARRIKCRGKIKHISIADGYMASMIRNREDRTKITITLVDLITFAERSFNSTVQDLDYSTYVSILNDSGTDSFTNREKGRSSQPLQLSNSPEFFRTNGSHVVFSASFLTHYTIWEVGINSDAPIIGNSYSLDPFWNGFLVDMWTSDATWDKHLPLSYYLSMDESCDIYTVIDGYLEERGCFYGYDRYLCRYACRMDGKPYRMKMTAVIPPYRNPDLGALPSCSIASRLFSFPSGGQNLFSYSPADTKDEEKEAIDMFPKDMIFFGDRTRFPRIVVDKKQPRHDEDRGFLYHDDFPPDMEFATEWEYNIQYLDQHAIYRFPTAEMRATRTSTAKLIPHLSPTSVLWQVQIKDEQIPMEGGEDLNVRKVQIIGLKPTFLVREKIVYKYHDNESSNTPHDEDHNDDGNDGEGNGDRNNDSENNNGENREDEGNDGQESHSRENNGKDNGEDEDSEGRMRYVFHNENVPEPASVCKMVLDHGLNRRLKWDGDDQYIVLRHYQPIPVPPGEEPPVPSFSTMFTLFRYGDEADAPISYNIRYHEASS
ncbi:hypothetical protein TWF225_004399 [Orbilia oligospora]|nr:hypothetical protein TWF225_004399 [Orbilia oligospora]KAF3260045.1 hypothetical protein TWF217_005068 [Orbilia oligospora]KAF3267128.1 hypothetical protein TWF128_010079 [Orbilia oligospora]